MSAFSLKTGAVAVARNRRDARVATTGSVLRAATSRILSACLIGGFAAPAFAVEPWIMVEKSTFVGVDSSRGQGVTTDGTNWYFSGTNALERTDGSFGTQSLVTPAIPDALKNPSAYSDAGLNHIGDIDYANGLLYISLDSSNHDPVTGGKYENPVFAVYDVATMTWTGQAFALNPPDGTHDIASWVAVDAAKGLGYGMAYDNATQIAVYNLSDWSFKEYIPLSQTIDQAQGGKILDGWMYFSSDDADKTLSRANLATGKVEVIGHLKTGEDQEIEGLSFRLTADGWSMNVLNREEDEDDTSIGFYKYLRPYGNALSGEIHADIKGALIEDDRYLRDAAGRRIRSAFGDIATPPANTAAFDGNGLHTAPGNADGVVIWTEALAMTGNAESGGYAAAFDHNTTGFVAGADLPVGDWRVGALAGYSHSGFDVSDRSSTGSSDNYSLGVYGGTEWGALGFRTGAIYGWHNVDTKRNVVFPAFNETLSAQYDAATLQAFGELGYRLDLGRAAFEPFVNLAYVHLSTDSFSETGGTTSVLSSGDSSSDETFSTLGLRSSMDFKSADMKATLHGMLGWQHAFDSVTRDAALSFNTGASFVISGAPIAKDALSIEAGLDFAATSRTTLGLSYVGQIASDSQAHAVKLNFDMKL